MPKVKEKKRGKWTLENMKDAMNALLRKKMTVRKASATYSLPRSTLRTRLKEIKAGKEVDLAPRMGRYKTVFNQTLEEQILIYVKYVNDLLTPFTRKEFLEFTYDMALMLKLPNKFNKDLQRAGKTFYYNFMSRHPELSLPDARRTNIRKPVGFSKDQVEKFFAKYKKLINTYKIKPECIFNCDETAVFVLPDTDTSSGAEKEKRVTILLTVNAAGNIFIPPLFVFPNKESIDLCQTKGAPIGSIFAAEENGWVSAPSFKMWLELLVEKTRPTKKKPILLILNLHASHKNIHVLKYAREHHIYMISLPPLSTHKMQPLDRAILKPFKLAFDEACNKWMRKNYPSKISLKDISSLVATAYTAICRMDLSQSAFECTGLWPINVDIFTEEDFNSSKRIQKRNPVQNNLICPSQEFQQKRNPVQNNLICPSQEFQQKRNPVQNNLLCPPQEIQQKRNPAQNNLPCPPQEFQPVIPHTITEPVPPPAAPIMNMQQNGYLFNNDNLFKAQCQYQMF